MFKRIFIANRGEVAVRIKKACKQMGITPVFGASTADATADYLKGEEVVVLGPGRASESYLDMRRVVQAAKQSQCTALHPGWGFLSENSAFAQLCEDHGITFIGPSPFVMALMGKKNPAKATAKKAGLRLIEGSDGVLPTLADAKSCAANIGYPVLIKAESGGGGRGMRIARKESELEAAYTEARAEAKAAFGDDRVYMEMLIENGRHVEIQILADRYGHVVHLGERDCTVQRNHQKLIEESPCPVLSPEERERTCAAAVKAAQMMGYIGAGTMEFLMDQKGQLRFMEMNARLQVEHCVSEVRTGIDLVEAQIKVAAGHPLAFKQEDIAFDGAVIECRINAENPVENFKPSPGTITTWKPAAFAFLRVDSHVNDGYVVPPHYDSLIAKLIAKGSDRKEATQNMLAALKGTKVEGVYTTIPMHQTILSSPEFQENRYTTRVIPGWK